MACVKQTSQAQKDNIMCCLSYMKFKSSLPCFETGVLLLCSPDCAGTYHCRPAAWPQTYRERSLLWLRMPQTCPTFNPSLSSLSSLCRITDLLLLSAASTHRGQKGVAEATQATMDRRQTTEQEGINTRASPQGHAPSSNWLPAVL